MSLKKITPSSFSGQPKYRIFDEVVDSLVDNGNSVVTNTRWGSNPTGYFCILEKRIDFQLLEQIFEFLSSVILDRKLGIIDYGQGTVVIRSR